METKLSAEHPAVTNSVEFIQGLKDKLFPNPFAAEKAVIKENREGQIGKEVTDKENWVGPVIKDAATDVLTQVAVGSAFKKPSPKVLRTYPPELPGTTTKGAITSIPQTRIDKFKPGSSPYISKLNTAEIAALSNLKLKLDPNYTQGEFFTDVDAVSRNLPDFITYPMAKDMPAYAKEVPAGYVDYYKMRNWFYASETSGRKALETYMTPVVPGTQISRGVSFGGLAKAELPKLKRDFAPILKALKIDNVDSANIHHIAALKATFGILHKVQYDSPLYREVYDTLLQHIPGLGNMGENLVPVIGRTKGKAQVSTPHYLVHRFYADKIGESGELFFTEEVLNKMVKSKAYRLKKANELGKIIARSEKIVKDAQRIWRLGFSQENIHFEVIVNELSKLDELGYSKLSSTKYQTPALSEMIKDIVTDIKGAKGPILQPPPKRKVDPSKITQRERMIKESDIIKETKAVDKGEKPSNPDQTKLDL
tara:strand:- start:274 stop:1716 length:1443 start_codon:yes stop_codon:yes gene_type:complete